jgi:hypothetical protein
VGDCYEAEILAAVVKLQLASDFLNTVEAAAYEGTVF